MLRYYQSLLARRPVLTQTVTTAVLFGAGDVLAQQAVEKKGLKKHDPYRTGRMVLYGAAVFGPAATLWYRLLNRVNLRTKAQTSLARVALDQGVFTPINLTVFLSSMAWGEAFPAGNPHAAAARAVPASQRVRDRLESTWLTALQKNYMVWPAVQLANFSLVPLEHRVLVVNVVALGWNCYLSYLNSQGSDKDEEAEGEKH